MSELDNRQTASPESRGRRIVLLLDGTWNEDQVGGNSTNIVRLRDIIAASLDPLDLLPSRPTGAAVAGRAETYARTFRGREYLIFYQRGVGTGPFDRATGGAFGEGLDANVRRAYRFLSFYYESGDEIFIFGFSRGAYTARSLTGYLGAIGLLRCETCDTAREQLAWSFYRTPPNDRLPGTWKQLEPSVHPREAFRVSCVGLFDTVGALGVPLQGLWRLNRKNFEFHDVELSPLVSVALHALAIDEHRRPFEASVLRRNKLRRTTARVEQVWFPGSHGDVGGGWLTDSQRDKAAARALDDLTLDWMIRRLLAHFPDFPISNDVWINVGEQESLGPLHGSRTGVYKLFLNAIRSIGNQPLPKKLLGGTDVSVGYDPQAVLERESVHIFAIKRVGTVAPTDRATALYAPANLVSCLPNLAHLYSDQGPKVASAETLTVTAMDGNAVEPHTEAAREVCSEILEAARRLAAANPSILERIPWRVPQ